MAEYGMIRVEKFNDQNYHMWNMYMEYYMYLKFMYLPLSIKSKKSTTMMDKEWDFSTKGTRNNMVVSSSVGGIQQFKGIQQRMLDDDIGQTI